MTVQIKRPQLELLSQNMSSPVPMAPSQGSWHWECCPGPTRSEVHRASPRSSKASSSSCLASYSHRPFSAPCCPSLGNQPASSVSYRTQREDYYLSLTFQKVRVQCRGSQHRKDTDTLLQCSRNLPGQPLPSLAPACCSGVGPLPLGSFCCHPPYPSQTPSSRAVRAPPQVPIAKYY